MSSALPAEPLGKPPGASDEGANSACRELRASCRHSARALSLACLFNLSELLFLNLEKGLNRTNFIQGSRTVPAHEFILPTSGRILKWLRIKCIHYN